MVKSSYPISWSESRWEEVKQLERAVFKAALSIRGVKWRYAPNRTSGPGVTPNSCVKQRPIPWYCQEEPWKEEIQRGAVFHLSSSWVPFGSTTLLEARKPTIVTTQFHWWLLEWWSSILLLLLFQLQDSDLRREGSQARCTEDGPRPTSYGNSWDRWNPTTDWHLSSLSSLALSL